jgi:cytochrome oxidase assembly protein ShyY1
MRVLGTEAGALPALDGEDTFQPAPGGLPVCKELVVDPEMNLNYAVQYYMRALRSFPSQVQGIWSLYTHGSSTVGSAGVTTRPAG